MYSFLLWTFCHVLSPSLIYQSGKWLAIMLPFIEPKTHYPSDSSSQNKSLIERSAWLKICELLIHLILYCIQLMETHRLLRKWFTKKIEQEGNVYLPSDKDSEQLGQAVSLVKIDRKGLITQELMSIWVLTTTSAWFFVALIWGSANSLGP